MQDKKKIIKLIISIFLFALGTLASLFISSYLHLLLSKGLDGIKIFGLFQAIKILIFDKKARNIFMILEIGTILLSVFYFFMKDNFYESELMEITPKIKIPKPAGQLQFGSARFMNDTEMENFFTVCEVNSKNSLMKELNKFGTNEFKTIKKVIEMEDKNVALETDEINKLEIDESYTQEELEKETEVNEKDNDKEIEKVYKYKIEEEIGILLEGDKNSLEYFNNLMKDIDKVIYLEKRKKYKEIGLKVDLMPEGDDRDRLKKRLELFINNTSKEMGDEIGKISNEKIQEELNQKLNQLYGEFDKKQKEYVEKIKSLLELKKEITSESDLNKYMNIAKDIEKRIDRLPNSEDKQNLFDKLFDFTDTIILENNKKYEEIEKMLW